MRMPSGVTDQYCYFVAVDATDFATRETGLSTFTVYRSRNGGVAAAMTTPTINETDSTNMPGVYELLLDEDTTIDAGDDSQEMVLHITHAGMAPVTRTIELYRAKITAGETLTVSSGLISNTTAIATTTNLTNERGKYANGSVWIGPTANTNTVSYTDGITTNPVSTIAAAKTIADALNMRRFEVIRTGAIQISATLAGYRVSGVGWSGNTTGGSQDVGTSAFIGGNITAGTFASTTGTINWERCEFSSGVTIGVSNVLESRFNGTLTLSTAGNYDFVDCASSVAGTGTPTFTVPAGTVNVSFRRWSGGITISGITSGTTVSIDMVSGGTITLNGADGNVQARGMCAGITDNRTGAPTLGQNAALNRTTIPDAVWDEALAGHLGVGSVGEALNAAGAAGDPWSTALPGAYGAGTAGKIIGDNINAPLSTIDTVVDAILVDTNELQTDWANGGRLDLILDARSSQTSVDDLPTNAELATALGTADDATLAAIAALSIPTATQNADALLNRDMSAVTDTNPRSPLNALRLLRNKWSVAGATMTVTKEDDAATAWTAALSTDAAAEPVTGSDPA